MTAQSSTWTKTFHRIWFDEEERVEFAAWRERLRDLHPDWQIKTWDRSEEVRRLIDDQPLRDAWDRYMASDPFGRIPDIARYLLLWHYGGIYVDTDFEPLRPMDDLLNDPRPFAAWENDRTMCTALLGAPAHHPAIGDLIAGLVDRLSATEGQTANNAAGPEYATALWREREDVRRLPPSSFYPVGWWEKHLLGNVDYPPETYAVHHWAKGWGKPTSKLAAVRAAGASAAVSLLVPFRDADGSRTRLWDFIRERLERLYPEAEIVVASDDGEDPFHKTMALNRAAAAATGDIFILWDSDTWVDVDVLKQAVAAVQENPERWASPYRMKIKLNEPTTEAILEAGAFWDGDVDLKTTGNHHRTSFKDAPPLVVSRSAWDAVKGQDERFHGWGNEDQAFAHCLNVMVGQCLPRFPGNAWHLNHHREGVSGNDTWIGQTLEQRKYSIWLMSRYRKARTPHDLKVLLEERDGGNGLHDGDGDGRDADRRDSVVVG